MKVTAVEDGEKAVAAFQAGEFHLVLTDLNMCGRTASADWPAKQRHCGLMMLRTDAARTRMHHALIAVFGMLRAV